MEKKTILTAATLAAVIFNSLHYDNAEAAGTFMPVASGVDVVKNEKAEIDVSHTEDGYFMARNLQPSSGILKVLLKGPSGTTYTYSLKNDGGYEVYPLSDSSGSYSIGVYEQITGSKYAAAITADTDVHLSDEFEPFIRPNQYVNYSPNDDVSKKAAELTAGKTSLIDKISAINNFIMENMDYDDSLASSVKSSYLPNVNSTLKNGKGICFDYAALMAAMLRSQQIPTKLVVGYTGEIYHAWISIYSTEAGQINNVIQFDENKWTLMDPTFADTGGQSDEVMKYISNESNYSPMFFY